MALTMRANAAAVPAPTANVVSRARGAVLRVTVADAGTSLGYLAIGSTAADPPGTYADLTNDLGGPSAGGALDFCSYEFNEDTALAQITIRHALPADGWDVGTKVWACWFDNHSATPDPTDVPDAVSSGFTVVA